VEDLWPAVRDGGEWGVLPARVQMWQIALRKRSGTGFVDEGQQANIRQVTTTDSAVFFGIRTVNGSPLAEGGEGHDRSLTLCDGRPPSAHDAIGDSGKYLRGERQLTWQRRKYVLLHGWLLVT